MGTRILAVFFCILLLMGITMVVISASHFGTTDDTSAGYLVAIMGGIIFFGVGLFGAFFNLYHMNSNCMNRVDRG